MSINFYGMPMLKSSVGLSTLFNLVEQGSIAGEAIFLDNELSEKIYKLKELEEEKYRDLAVKARSEFDIKPPQPEKCASVLSYIGKCLSVSIGGVFEGLFSSMGLLVPIAIIAGAILLLKD